MEQMRFILFLFFIVLVSLSTQVRGQDEKFVRELLVQPSQGLTEQRDDVGTWVVQSPFYTLDLDQDGKEEKLRIQKQEGLSRLMIFDSSEELLWSQAFLAQGRESYLYKLQLADLSNKEKILLAYFYEGFAEGKDFAAKSTVYFITFEKGKRNSFAAVRGPSFFLEETQQKVNYLKRHYKIFLHDYNQDGLKEVGLKFGKISRVYFYQGKGRWKNF